MSADKSPPSKHAEYNRLKVVPGCTTAEYMHKGTGKQAPRNTRMVEIMDNQVKTKTVNGNMKHC